MSFDRDHNIEKVLGGNESGAIFIFDTEGNVGVLLVEIVKKLGKLSISDVSLLVLAKVELAKVRVKGEGHGMVDGGLFDDVLELL